MGKKTKSKTKLKKEKANNSIIVVKSEEHAQQLIDQADIKMQLGDMESAISIYDAVANMYKSILDDKGPLMRKRRKITLAKVHCSGGEACVTIGDIERGKTHFQEGIALLHDDFFFSPSLLPEEEEEIELLQEERHDVLAGLLFYLGQSTADGKEALQCYQDGIEQLKYSFDILIKQEEVMCSNPNNSIIFSPKEMIRETKNRLCAAYCSIAELYLTDLCFEPDAEQNCEAAVELALQLDNSSPEPLQIKANLRLRQSNVEDATTFILKAYQELETGCTALASLVGYAVQNNDDDDDVIIASELNSSQQDAADRLPGFDFRIQTAKILLECADSLNEKITMEEEERHNGNQCAEAAIQVLGSLMAVDDEVIEIWYLLGCAAMATSPSPNPEMAMYHWTKATEMLNKVKLDLEEKLSEGRNEDTEEIQQEMEMVKSKLEEIKSKQDDTQGLMSLEMT